MSEDAKMFSDANNPRIVELHDGFCLVGPDKFCLSTTHIDDLDRIYEFQVRDSDTIVASFPNSGSPLIADMVWLLKNNFDYAETRQKSFFERIPAFEKHAALNRYPEIEFEEAWADSLSYASKQSDPRCMMTFLPFSMLPADITTKFKHPKLIHAYRHPAEVCKACYDYLTTSSKTTKNFPTYAKKFMEDYVFMGPFWKHVLGYWETRNEQDIMFVKYEDIEKNLPAVINSVAKFIDVNVSHEQLADLLSHLTRLRETVPSTSFDTPCCSTTNPSAVGSTDAIVTEAINNWFDFWCSLETSNTEFDWKRKL